jgi:hypothetical protein
MVAFLGFNSVTGAEFNNLPSVTNFTQEAPAKSEVAPKTSVVPSDEDLSSQKVVSENNSINFRASNTLFAGLAKDGTPVGFTVSDAAGNIGISIDKDFMEVIRGLDAEQFKLWSATLFDVAKNGRITGLKDDFVLINAAMTTGTIGTYIDDLKSASREIENQVKAQVALTKEGYNSIEIQKILENKTLVAAIAARGFLSASIEERKELNVEITILEFTTAKLLFK